MQAIAFMTKNEKGVIKIPKEYQNLLQDEFQVIIVLEKPEIKKNKKKK